MFNVLTELNIATYMIPKRADSLLGIFYIVSYWSHYTSLLLVYWLSETTAGTTTNYAWDNSGNPIKKISPEGEISYSWSSSYKLLSIDDQVNQRQTSYKFLKSIIFTFDIYIYIKMLTQHTNKVK
ncbi:hypothetical protein SASC598O11_004390 [Snodgrassella alvi SCGC AB-598-O11]|nr:hypothetical protein SASC598O11_004390 [Snodgrassella alvi SCGC AB-598-O11]